MMENFGSGGRKKSFIISHSGKFKSKNKKRITITDDLWIGPTDTYKSKATLPDTQKPVTNTQIEINGLPSSDITDKRLSSDKSLRETAGNQQ